VYIHFLKHENNILVTNRQCRWKTTCFQWFESILLHLM